MHPIFSPLVPFLFRSDVEDCRVINCDDGPEPEYSTCKKELRKLFSSRKEAKEYPMETCSDLKSGYKDNRDYVFSMLAQTIQGVALENSRKWKVPVGN